MIGAVMVLSLIGPEGTLAPAAAFRHCRSFEAADIQYGDTIGPGERVKLTQDIGPCADDVVITVVGPAVLDLNGHTIADNGHIKNKTHYPATHKLGGGYGAETALPSGFCTAYFVGPSLLT